MKRSSLAEDNALRYEHYGNINNPNTDNGKRYVYKTLRADAAVDQTASLERVGEREEPGEPTRATSNYSPTKNGPDQHDCLHCPWEFTVVDDDLAATRSLIARICQGRSARLKSTSNICCNAVDFNIDDDDHGSIPWQKLDRASLKSAKDDPRVHFIWRPDRKQCRNTHKKYGNNRMQFIC